MRVYHKDLEERLIAWVDWLRELRVLLHAFEEGALSAGWIQERVGLTIAELTQASANEPDHYSP